MAAAFIEHRPYSSSEHVPTSHFVLIVNENQVGGNFQTQAKAKDWACSQGYRPVHVARVRHLQDRAQPAHWRSDPC